MTVRGINKVIIVGNLGQDPEVRYMPNGGAVANLSLATSESWRDKQTGEMRENTEWHRVVLFGKLANRLKRSQRSIRMSRLKTIRERTFAWWFVRTAKWCGGYGILSRVVST